MSLASIFVVLVLFGPFQTLFDPFFANFMYLNEGIKFQKLKNAFCFDFCRSGTFQTILDHFWPFFAHFMYLNVGIKFEKLKKWIWLWFLSFWDFPTKNGDLNHILRVTWAKMSVICVKNKKNVNKQLKSKQKM